MIIDGKIPGPGWRLCKYSPSIYGGRGDRLEWERYIFEHIR
jgi:hypothetical protein